MATATGQLPRVIVIRQRVAAVGTAGNDLETPLGTCEPTENSLSLTDTYTVTSVKYIPDADRAGADTNSRTLTLYNRGAAAAGTTVIAQLALVSGVDLTKWVPKTITLTATTADRDVTVAQVLSFNSLHVLTGIADPGGVVEVTLSRA